MSQLLTTDASEPQATDAASELEAPLVRSKPSTARAAAAAKALGLAPEPVAEPERHLRVVEVAERTPAQRRRRARALLGGSALLAVGVAFALVYLHVVLAQRQFRLDNLNAQVQQEQLSYQKLRLQVAEMGSPQNIIKTAEGHLGMIQPASVNWITSSTTVAPASAAHGGTDTNAPAGDANWPAIKSQLAGSP
jgi:cell division protein FtsL